MKKKKQATSERALEGWRSFTAKCEKQSFLANAEPFRTFSNARKYQFKILIKYFTFTDCGGGGSTSKQMQAKARSKSACYCGKSSFGEISSEKEGLFWTRIQLCPHSNTTLCWQWAQHIGISPDLFSSFAYQASQIPLYWGSYSLPEHRMFSLIPYISSRKACEVES